MAVGASAGGAMPARPGEKAVGGLVVNTAGTAGRDMRVAIGSGVLLGAIALACFAAGTVASMVIVCIVVTSLSLSSRRPVSAPDA